MYSWMEWNVVAESASAEVRNSLLQMERNRPWPRLPSTISTITFIHMNIYLW